MQASHLQPHTQCSVHICMKCAQRDEHCFVLYQTNTICILSLFFTQILFFFAQFLRTLFYGFINCSSCTITHSDVTLPPYVLSLEVVRYPGAPLLALAVAHIFLSLHYILSCARVSKVGRGPFLVRLSFYGQRALSRTYLTHACYTLHPEGLRPGGSHWTLLICRG